MLGDGNVRDLLYNRRGRSLSQRNFVCFLGNLSSISLFSCAQKFLHGDPSQLNGGHLRYCLCLPADGAHCNLSAHCKISIVSGDSLSLRTAFLRLDS